MLVVVKNWDVKQLAKTLLDDEALRRLDIFEIDATEAGSQEAHTVDELVDVPCVDLKVDAVDVGEALEKNSLALHDRLCRQRPQIAQAQYRCAVRYDGNQVALGCVVVNER